MSRKGTRGGPGSLPDCTTGGKTSYRTARVNGRCMRRHRWAYATAFGPIPADLYVLHRCDNPPCDNPTHLFLGTAHDNTDDALRKGRLAVSAAYRNAAAIAVSTDSITTLADRYECSRRTIYRIRRSHAAIAARMGSVIL